MKEKSLLVLVLVLVVLVVYMIITGCQADAHASGWKFYIQGVDIGAMADRPVVPMIAGAVASLVVHELGHVLTAENPRVTIEATGPVVWSDKSTPLLHGAGFLAQLVVGAGLTAHPRTRHEAWVVGFNAFTAWNSAVYAINNPDGSTSDIYHLTRHGYNGEALGVATGLAGGLLTIVNMKGE